MNLDKFKKYIVFIAIGLILFSGGYLTGRYFVPVISKEILPLSQEQKSVLKDTINLIEKESYFKNEFDWTKIFKGLLSGIVQSLGDPYSYTLEEEDYKHLKDEARGFYGGVGIQLGLKESNKIVIAPFPDTPASRAGVQSGDIVIKVDGINVEGFTLERVAGMIRGNPDTKVQIEFKRGDSAYEVNLIRQIIKIITVESKMLNKTLGYLKISLFNEVTPDDVEKAISNLVKLGSKGFVIDLRKNPGGLLEPAVDVAKLFIKGEIVSIVDNDGRSQTYKGTDPRYKLPLSVWIDEGTASASEIIAGALQDHDAAILIGRKTFGKGSVQRVWNLKDGTALKLTIAKYKLPSGRFINDKGLIPDFELPANSNDEKYLEETLKYLDNL